MSVAAVEDVSVESEEPSAPFLETSLVFTGTGSEYFRIWVVNTLLTLLTLGLYGAWAKVRRTRYLWQNTRLDGFAFDYHARPLAILRGRILALGLFGAYTYAFDFSRNVGVVVVLGLCVIGPWLFMRAQQFKLANTSWRGLRFGFDARTPEAYRVVLPILVVWFSATLLPVWFSDDLQLVLWSQFGVFLPIPWMHHRLKAYQHGRAYYGDRAFSFRSSMLAFFGVYLKGLLFVALGAAVGVGVMTAAIVGYMFLDSGEGYEPPTPLVIAGGLISLLTLFVVAWPYLAARLQQVVWSRTTLGDIRFHTRIRASHLFRLTVRNVFLTVITLGLYWPFAAMRFAKYRIECMHLTSDLPFAGIAAGTHPRAVGAGGDSVADAFGLDLGL